MSSDNLNLIQSGSSPGQSAASVLLSEKLPSSVLNCSDIKTDDTELHTEIDAIGKIGDSHSTIHKSTYGKQEISKVDHYHMNRPNRGFAVIINNENFHWTTGMNRRNGTDVDARNLKRVFKKLGFSVHAYKDTTCVALHEIIQSMADGDHEGYDCFMCAILSHGDDGCVYGTDGTVKIKMLVDQFRGDNCPSLAGKPKIFIFQACRGTQHEIPVPPAKDVVDAPIVEKDIHTIAVDAAPSPTLPSGSDFLFCYSVVEGFYSHRDTLYGSWYVQDFTSVMEAMVLNSGEHHEPVDFLDILTEVNRKVSNRRVERSLSSSSLGKKQMPCFLSMLTKKLYLMKKCKSEQY